jgi:hypothetical protein
MQPVGNQTVYVTPYIVFERTHQHPWKNLGTPQKRVLQHSRRHSDRRRRLIHDIIEAPARLTYLKFCAGCLGRAIPAVG